MKRGVRVGVEVGTTGKLLVAVGILGEIESLGDGMSVGVGETSGSGEGGGSGSSSCAATERMKRERTMTRRAVSLSLLKKTAIVECELVFRRKSEWVNVDVDVNADVFAEGCK